MTRATWVVGLAQMDKSALRGSREFLRKIRLTQSPTLEKSQMQNSALVLQK
jgi:hypothetical protein